MKGARIALTVAAVVTLATIASAQKPDFSGTWTLDEKATGAPAQAPVMLIVKQTADTLTMEGESPTGARQTRTYKLDGTESVNTIGRGGQPIEVRSTAKWDDDKLVITQKAADAGRTMTWSMTAGILTIETVEGSPGSSTKRTYKKVR